MYRTLYAVLAGSVLLPSVQLNSQSRCDNLEKFVDSIGIADSTLPGDSIGALSNCPEKLVTLAPALWKNVRNDSVFLHNLVASSSAVKDEKVKDVVKSVWMDPARPVLDRMAAYHVMLSYFLGSRSSPEAVKLRPTTKQDSSGRDTADASDARKKVWIISNSPRAGPRLPPLKQVDAGAPINDSIFKEEFKKLLLASVNEFFPDAKGRFRSYSHESLYFHMKGTYEANFIKKRFQP